MRVRFYISLVFLVVLFVPLAAEGQTNEFTYQGKLSDGSMPANGNYDFQFVLFPTPSAGVLIGSRDRLGVEVSDGSFTVTLDFPATNFNGSNRYLEIRIKTAGSPDPYTILTPRQKVSSAPYAIQSLNSTNAVNATTATNSTQLGGVAASQFVQTNDSRLSDARNPLPGSPDYIQNNSGVPQNGNFAVSGNGSIGGNALIGGTLTATSVSASGAGGYKIGATPVLSTAGTNNLFVGLLAGNSNTTGYDNSFFGRSAGTQNTEGGQNSFFGWSAGSANTFGLHNSFFGAHAGNVNTVGGANSFFGAYAGGGQNNGAYNSFFGYVAGSSNTSGNRNTAIGAYADVDSGGLTYATAIGAGAVATESSSVVLGRSDDIVYVPGFLRLVRLGGAGTVALCRNNANTIGTCSSSLRYKTNIGRFGPGLDLVKRLKPITFDWKDGGMHDLGLGAEDVAAIEPLLVTYNKSGQVEGVKYDRIGVVLVNAVKEQQKQIEEQREQIEEQREQIEEQREQIEEQREQIEEQREQIGALKAALCETNPRLALCKR